MPNVRRMRFATKGPAVMPQKILTDDAWTRRAHARRRARAQAAQGGRAPHPLQPPAEITAITKAAMDKLFERGITVRNQTVLQRRVNDDVATMRLLVKRLSYVNVHPYYIYVHDLVKGVEDLRTTLRRRSTIEKGIRGATAGFNTPPGRRRRARRRRQARRALVRALRSRQPASRSSRPQRSPGRLLLLLRSDRSAAPVEGRRAGPIRRSTRP